jgi:dipeptidyl aminopeptidase/acylaminoacyl peptidase
VLRKFDVDSQTFSDPIISNTEFDIVNVSFGSATDDHAQLNDAIREYCWQGPIIECQSNDPTDNRIRAFLETRFPGSNISMVLRNDGKSVLFTVSAPNRPPVFYFLKNETQLTRIGSIREDLGQKNLGAAFWISYAARDGLEITGILTLPYGYNMERDGRIPLVVMPHGGPWGGPDELDFDVSYWTQMFATRGFAVLQPNFRGTEGLGRTLWRAGDNEWGAKMSDDNDDGAKWLVELGIADPNRMMIYGYSYGGFAAAAAAARSGTVAPGLWQCAISGAPIINLARVANDWGESRFAKLVQGSTVTGWNPFDHLSEVRIPWLIVHGSKDVQADVVHSTDTATAMSRVNPMANFKLVLVDGMAHTLDNMLREHKTILMSEILDWTANHCGNISANFNDDEATLMVQERQSSAANRRPHRTKSQ